MEAGTVSSKTAGCHGMSLAVEKLWWLDYATAFIFPPAHCLLYGIVRAFFDELFTTDDVFYRLGVGRPKAIIMQLAEEFTLTPEFPKPYRCILTRRGYYTMEDWLVFMDTFGPYIFQRLLEEGELVGDRTVILEMFGCLRRAVQHYLRPGPYSPEASAAAGNDLRQYAKLIEEVRALAPLDLLTLKVKILTC